MDKSAAKAAEESLKKKDEADADFWSEISQIDLALYKALASSQFESKAEVLAEPLPPRERQALVVFGL